MGGEGRRAYVCGFLLAAVLAAGGCGGGESWQHSVRTPARPWTRGRALDQDGDFHFAVVADRTGGCRPGVFATAVDRLNRLRPALVLSVGDYVQGYTDDPMQINREWDEWEAVVGRLEAPFFHVPGNHEVGPAAWADPGHPQVRAWRARRGPDHYAFVYRDTLFMLLNCMADGGYGLGTEQLAWARQVLRRRAGVRWTFVFTHFPLWVRGRAVAGEDGPDPAFLALAETMAARPHTVFAGHWHTYRRYRMNGWDYFALATTGGVIPVEPEHAAGKGDQILWVSMADDGPRVLNIAMDGLRDPAFVTAPEPGAAAPGGG